MNQHNHLRRGLLALLVGAGSLAASAQRVSLKTNALYWATASPNLGVEFRLNRHLTLNLEGAANRLSFSNDDFYTRILSFTPEMRWWFSARPQAGHFVGLMGFATNYKVHFNDYWHDGDCYGAGVSYGYSFVLGRRWSMETTVGLGLLRIREDKYAADYAGSESTTESPNNVRWTPAPLKAGVTFVYILK